MKQAGLGKGLGALLTTNVDTISQNANNKEDLNKEKIYNLKISKIEPDKNQPRTDFKEEKIDELAQSIKEHGVIQPIIVTKKGEFYQIIAGERRWRASKKAGLKEIPAIIRDDDEKLNKQISLIENIQRQDLNPIEEAIAIKNIMEEQNLTQEDVAKILGKSRSSVANTVRMINLDERVKELVVDGKLTFGHCKILLGVEKEKQYKLACEIIEKNESVSELNKKTKEKSTKTKKSTNKMNIIYKDIEEQFKNYFGTKVSMVAGKNKGKIVIEYFSNEELERILELIKS